MERILFQGKVSDVAEINGKYRCGKEDQKAGSRPEWKLLNGKGSLKEASQRYQTSLNKEW